MRVRPSPRPVPGCGVLAPLVVLLVAAGCGPASEPPRPPPGLYLAGDAGAARRLAGALAALEGTPLARAARVFAAESRGCDELAAGAPSGDLGELLDALTCQTEPLPAALRPARERGDLVLSTALQGGGYVVTALRVASDGSVEALVTVDPVPSAGTLTFLLPAEAPPAPARLSGRDAVFHARLRPTGGLALRTLFGDAGQADSLFALKSELFAGAALEGSVELASYLPQPGRSMPGLALAVPVRLRAAAVAGMERFVSDLEATWPIHRTPLVVGPHSGACFLELRILPEFAPCYVATGDALVVGWNRASLEEALAPGATTGSDGPELVVELARLAEADARLREALAPDAPDASLPYPWERLVVERRHEEGPVSFEVRLTATQVGG